MTEQMFTKETIATGTDTHATTPPTFPTVGLVGAAGSRQALESFFRTLPDDSGMAFVVVTRLAAKHNQQLSAALEARTDMPVMIAADGAPIQADHVYIAPPGVELTLEQGQFRLQNLDRTAAQGPLDTFLTALATDQGDNAVAVLLSGMGEDGIAGLQQIKAQGGMILVQDPNDAAHAALPRRGVALEGVARIGTASELAQYLVQSKGDLANLPLVVNEEQDDSLNQIFAAILLEILKQTGHDLSHYKPSTLHRRILRRMGMAGSSSLPQYLELLQANPDETTALFRDCLVSVTSFFRDSDAYEMLERDCIPQLFLNKGRSDFVRVWVAGCATGEEAYSVAIQLAERAAQVNEPPRLQVFATDIDEDAIAIARRGFYSPAVAKDIAPARLQRYFVEENGCYRVKPELREHVLFAVHDLLKDPPFSRLDLICCRNVLIYFNREAQEKVFTIFHYALNPNGYLFLGTSESSDAAQDLFGVFNKHCHLYQRRDVIMAPPRRLGTSAPAPPAALSGKANERLAQRQTDKPRTVEEMYTAWSLRVHTPPRLLINENYDITHLFGGADRYFQERDGAITQNALQKILPDLRLDLRAALYQAFNKRERTISRLLRVELPNLSQMLQLHVGPVMEPGFPQEYVEVVFVVQDDAALLGLPATGEALETDLSLVARMEEELLRTRERLQTIIEEYEISGQELKASNEELQSINEELKSTTEELETSKEELQSMNEELITVNSELTRKIDELHRANSDLLNLVASTDVGAIFLSNTLHIKRFTPRATDLFNLIEGDIGRPFAHVTHRLRHTGLPHLAAHVNTTHERIEETVQRDDDRWYILRVFPYHTISGENDGVVITFVDINDLKRAESEERQRRQQQSLAELSRQALTGSDLDTLLTAAAHRVAEVLEMELCKVLERQPDGATLLLKAGVGWHEGLVGQTTVPADTTSQAGYTLQSHAPVIVRDLQTETRFHTPALLTEHDVRSGMGVMIPAPDGAYGVLSVHSRQLHTFATYDVDYLQSVANLLATAIIRRRAETALRAEEQRYRFIFESVGVSLWEEDFTGVKALIDQMTAQGVSDLRAHLTAHPEIIAQAIAAVKIRDVNQHTLTLFGAESKEQLLISLDRIFTPETVTAFLEEMITLAEGRQYYATETTLQTLQGEQRHVILTVTFPATTDELQRVVVSILDISDRKAAEAALRESEERFRIMANSAPVLIWVSGLDQGYTFFNKAWLEFTGRTMEQELGDGWMQGIHPDDHDRCLSTYTTAFAAHQDFVIEYRLRYHDGSYRWVLDKGTPRLAPDGSFAGFIGGCIDIDDRKTAEVLLTRYQLLSDQARDLILFMQLDGQIVEANNAAAEAYGYDRTSLLRMKIHDLRDPATLSTVASQIVQANQAEDGRGVRFETIHRRRDGSTFPVEVSSIGANVGGERLLLSVIRDITERKAAEAALQASETQLRLVTDNITGLTSYVDRKECYRFVNAVYERWFARSRAQIVGLSVREAVGDLAYAQVQPYIGRALAGERVRFESTLTYADGVHRTVMATYVPDVDADGQVQGFYALVTDITERKQAEERLRFLAEASTMLASSLDYTVTLENVARAAVPDVADWCTIDLVNEDGSFEDGIIAHVDPEKVHWAEELRIRYPIDPNAPAGAPQVIRTGQSEIYPEITDEMLQAVAKNEEELQLLRSVGYRSVMIVPLKTHGRILGAITFVATETERHFDATDLTMAEELAQRAASAIGNAQLHRAVQQREQQLRISEERLRLVTEAGNIGFYDHDLLTRRTTFSDIYREITGVKPDEQLTREMWLARVYPEDCAMVAETLERAVTYGESYNYEYRIYRPDGELRWLGINSRVLVNEEGRAVRLIGALNDITERKQAEEEIQRLNRDLKRRLVELQALLDVAPIGIFVAHDPACQVITSNAVGAQMLGIQPRENASKSAPHGDELPFRVLRNGRELTPDELPMQYAVTHDMPIYNWDVDVIRADGRVVHLYEYAIPLHDEENNVRGCLGIFVDITERKQAEEALRESEERFRSTFEQAAVGMAHLAIDGRYLRVNDRLCEILGYSREELLQKSFIDVTHPADLAADLAQMERQLAGEIVHHSMEKRYLRKDGATVWANMTASVVRDDTGTPKYGIVVIEEISARKAAEEEKARLAMQIATEQERLAVILEHLPAGVLIAEATGELILSNPEVERIFKHPFRATPDIAGYRTWQLFDPKTGEEYHLERMPMVRTLTTGETVIGEEMKILRGDGTWGYASVNSAPVRDGDGHILMGVAAFIDTTARRQAEEELRRLNMTLEQRVAERTAELERSNQELDQFAYVASHDLKAPLRAIINLAGWIDEDAGALLPAPSLEHLQKLRGRALRMERLLDDLLTYSRIGRRDGVIEEIKTEALVQDAIYLLALPPGFTVKVDGELPVLLAPRTPLDLIFRNLISNAIKHHHQPAQGVIWIQARDLGDFVEFRIHDNGPGIEPQYHERIFGMFQTLRPRDEVEGSGMGLAIAKRAVEYRGGVIRVESAVGQGTTFCFTWPKKAVPNDTDSRE